MNGAHCGRAVGINQDAGLRLQQLFQVSDDLFVEVSTGDDHLLRGTQTGDQVFQNIGSVPLNLGGACQQVPDRGVGFIEEQDCTPAGFGVEVAAAIGVLTVEHHNFSVGISVSHRFDFGAEPDAPSAIEVARRDG